MCEAMHRAGTQCEVVGTLIELPATRRELSLARFVALAGKLQLLDASAALAFPTGESPQDQQPGR